MSYPFGIYSNITNEDYHAADGYSSSFVKLAIDHSLYKAKHGAAVIAAATRNRGTAVHSLILEPEQNDIILGPVSKNSNAFKEMRIEAEARGKLVLTPKEYDQANRMAEAVLSHEPAARLLSSSDAIKEASIFVEHPTGLKLKARPDCYLPHHGLLLDIKTAQSSHPRTFSRSCYNYRYDIQAAWYRLVCQLHGFEVNDVTFITVEVDKPHTVHLHTMMSDALNFADTQIEQILPQILSAEQSGIWPTNWGAVSYVGLPAYLEEEIN